MNSGKPPFGEDEDETTTPADGDCTALGAEVLALTDHRSALPLPTDTVRDLAFVHLDAPAATEAKTFGDSLDAPTWNERALPLPPSGTAGESKKRDKSTEVDAPPVRVSFKKPRP